MEYFENRTYRISEVPELNRMKRKFALRLHPDHGGKSEDFIQMMREYEAVVETAYRERYETYETIETTEPDNNADAIFSEKPHGSENALGDFFLSIHRGSERISDFFGYLKTMDPTISLFLKFGLFFVGAMFPMTFLTPVALFVAYIRKEGGLYFLFTFLALFSVREGLSTLETWIFFGAFGIGLLFFEKMFFHHKNQERTPLFSV